MLWHSDSSFKAVPSLCSVLSACLIPPADALPLEEGRALLATLLDHVTQPQFCYRHEWTEGDLVIWDNRCVLHRATPYDTTRYKRLMQRTIVSGDPADPAVLSAAAR